MPAYYGRYALPSLEDIAPVLGLSALTPTPFEFGDISRGVRNLYGIGGGEPEPVPESMPDFSDVVSGASTSIAPVQPATELPPAQYSNIEEFKRLAETGGASPGTGTVKVTIDGKTYDYSRGRRGGAPGLSAPPAYAEPAAPTAGPIMPGEERTFMRPPTAYGEGIDMSQSLTPEQMASERARGGTGVSIMHGTPEQQQRVEFEQLGRDAAVAEQRASLMKQQLAGPATGPRPRTWGDVKQEEQRQRLTGIEGSIQSRYGAATPQGQARRATLAREAAAMLQSTPEQAKLWSVMSPEQREATLRQEVEGRIQDIMASEFQRAVVIESLLAGAASPAAQYLRPRPIGTESPSYYSGYGAY